MVHVCRTPPFCRTPLGIALSRIALASLLAASPTIGYAFDWADLWRTPAQRAQAQLESGEFAALANDAPSDTWSGLANYRAGDFDTATKRFAAARAQGSETGDADAALTATYNQANAALKNHQFQEAMALYDEVLAGDPAHADALHNQALAEQALAMQQQQPQPQPGEQSDQPQDGEQSGEQSAGDESADQSSQAGDESQSEDSQQSDSDDPSQADNAGANSDGSSAQADDQQQGAESPDEQEEQDAAAALAASAAEEEAALQDEGELLGLSDEERPLTESEQATEQWLRRIPDNPAGLLRRKLEQSHLNEYPEVGNSARPW